MKQILIVGAAGGIGELLVKELLKNKYDDFILVARNEVKLDLLIQQLKQINPNVKITKYLCDLTNQQQTQLLANNLINHNIDLYIHNAGIGNFGLVGGIDYSKLNDVFNTNTLAPIIITNHIINKMYDNNKGHIIYVGSLLSKFTFANTSVYASSKFALRGFVKALRFEAKEHNVKVSLVNPNAIKNDFFKNANDSGEFIKKYTKDFLDPNVVVKNIIKLVNKPKDEIDLPKKLGWLYKFTTLFSNLSNKLIYKKQIKNK